MSKHGSVGFAGLGNVGRHMAANLARAGYELVVCDVDADRARSFAGEYGAAVADEPLGLAAADAVVTMLPNGDIVREVVLESGLADALGAGSLVLDTSSSDPLATRALGAELGTRGIDLVDAGVSMPEGGRADERMITFMVGADNDATFERARVLLDAMGTQIFRLGPLGAGHAMKTLNNYVGAAGLGAALDALVLGRGFGLDPAVMLDVLNVSTGRNFSTEFPLRERAIAGRFDTGYAMSLLIKDLRIAARFAEHAAFDVPLLAVLDEQFTDAHEALGGGAVDHLAALRRWEDRAGVRVSSSGPPPAA